MADGRDPIKDLVQRLVAMSPEAPPFPEEKMVQLDTKKSREAASPKRGLGQLGWAVAGAVAVLVLIGVPAFLLGALRFGGDDVANPTTVITEVPPTSTAPNTTAPSTTDVPATTVPVTPPPPVMYTTVYVLGEYGESNRPGPLLLPVSVPAVGSASDPVEVALETLVTGGWRSFTAGSAEIPDGTTLLGVERDGSVLRVDLSSEFESGGGTASMSARLAQVVFTATRFADVDSVLFLIDGEPVGVFSGEGLVLDGPQTRDDYQDWLPLIMIEDPATGSEVEGPGTFTVSGVANTFEANLVYSVVDLRTGETVVEDFTTATCGTGCWGEFSFTVPVDATEVTQYQIEAFEYSARDGAKVNVATAVVAVSPAE